MSRVGRPEQTSRFSPFDEVENTIRIERAVLRITQAELATRVQVSRQAINAVETGKYVPSTILAIKIARVFGKRVEDIFAIAAED